MEKNELKKYDIKRNISDYNSNNSFSLLIPYYTSDKWTNKLKNKVKSLAEAYKAFYKRLEQENSLNSEREDEIGYDNIRTMKNRKYFSPNYINKTTTNLRNNLFNTDNEENNQKNILNTIIPPVTNFKNFDNESKDNTYNYNNLTSTFFYPKDNNLFRISAQQRNQKANMNKYYSNQKMKDFFYFKNHKNINSTKNLFSSKAQNEDYNKFIMECQNKNRISFFKKNDYNPRIKSTQPKDRRQISAMKSLKKKQYLDYIKAKSEDNYMKYYYYQ